MSQELCTNCYDADYYEKTGNNYRDRFEFQLANLWRALYVKLFFHPQAVLDVGGGMGLLVERLQSMNCRACGVEISHYAITQAPEMVSTAFVQGRMEALPFPDNSFDVVTSVNVLEHMRPEAVASALRECARVARRGIYHEITVMEDRTVIHRDPTHYTKLSASRWLALMNDFLPGWRVRRGLRVPVYKNGIFLCRYEAGIERAPELR